MTRFCSLPFSGLLLCLTFAQPHALRAHSGPPFPIVNEQPIPGYLVSLWTDPDIGQSTFFVVLEPDKSASHGAISSVDIAVQPVSGRLPKAVYHAAREDARSSLRFTVHPELDAQELWRVDADIHLAGGSTRSFTAQVEATPPGGGPWGLLLFLLPILLFGGLWTLVFIRRSRAASTRSRSSRPRCEAVAPGELPPAPPS